MNAAIIKALVSNQMTGIICLKRIIRSIEAQSDSKQEFIGEIDRLIAGNQALIKTLTIEEAGPPKELQNVVKNFKAKLAAKNKPQLAAKTKSPVKKKK